MGYGTLEHKFWEDPDLQELGLPGMGFAAYLLTCRHSSTEGYYRIAVGYICDDLRIDAVTAVEYLRILDLKDFARYDAASQVLFIRNAMRYRPVRGIKTVTAALRRASEVPLNPFRGMFYDAAVQWAPEFALALQAAGWCSENGQHTPSLFTVDALSLPTPQRALPPAPTLEDDEIEAVMRRAAILSVQVSMARGEQIRSADAVARTRLNTNRAQWRSVVEGWRTLFDVSAEDMAKALADGGRAAHWWRRATTS